mgnify:CR=1 FL=1
MSIVQQINEGLQTLGFSQSLADQLDQFIAFLGVLLVSSVKNGSLPEDLAESRFAFGKANKSHLG